MVTSACLSTAADAMIRLRPAPSHLPSCAPAPLPGGAAMREMLIRLPGCEPDSTS
jgi:hypothetical protein